MRKVALILFLAVLLPSLVLAWLAVRSLNDQQLVLERQQTLLYQGSADRVAAEISAAVLEEQRKFRRVVTTLLERQTSGAPFTDFDAAVRSVYPLARVGFVVTLDGNLIAPSLLGTAEARRFRVENEKFLTNRESVDVYWNGPKGAINLSQLDATPTLPHSTSQLGSSQVDQSFSQKKALRNVMPQQQQMQQQAVAAPVEESQVYSKSASAEAAFRQLIGDSQEGGFARFLQDKLNLIFWCRNPAAPNTIYGSLIDVAKLAADLRRYVALESQFDAEIGVALLDDTGRQLATDPRDLRADWRRPFVAAEVGDVLPHWEVAVYLRDPTRFERTASTLKWTIGLVIELLVVAITMGSLLLILDLRRQMTLARQKTDFVSNVSHELKTPLTSIRMFSELLAEGRVTDEKKRKSYLQIISAEAARLTRLINNVLSFARLERGEQRFQRARLDLVQVVQEVMESYIPQLETAGFNVDCSFPPRPVWVEADRDGISQVIVNLVANAEKYATEGRTIRVQVTAEEAVALARVKDRGPGVPAGLEKRIFEQFFRADDSLASGIQGSGLGLTLARQIARAHGGDVTYESRPKGGSCFTLRLPLSPSPA